MTDDQLVTQSDRDAVEQARAFCDDMNEPEMVELFARHRLTHSPASDVGDSELAEVMRDLKNSCTDYDGTRIPDAGEPIHAVTAGQIRTILRALRSQPASPDADCEYCFGTGSVETGGDEAHTAFSVACICTATAKQLAALTPTTLASADDGLCARTLEEAAKAIRSLMQPWVDRYHAGEKDSLRFNGMIDGAELALKAVTNLKPKPEQEAG